MDGYDTWLYNEFLVVIWKEDFIEDVFYFGLLTLGEDICYPEFGVLIVFWEVYCTIVVMIREYEHERSVQSFFILPNNAVANRE
jgi:hypothetical protein